MTSPTTSTTSSSSGSHFRATGESRDGAKINRFQRIDQVKAALATLVKVLIASLAFIALCAAGIALALGAKALVVVAVAVSAPLLAIVALQVLVNNHFFLI